MFLTDKPDILACKFELRYDAVYSPGPSDEPKPCRLVITGEALLPVGTGPVLSLEFDTSQIDDGPVVSWAEPSDIGARRRFSDLEERPARLKA